MRRIQANLRGTCKYTLKDKTICVRISSYKLKVLLHLAFRIISLFGSVCEIFLHVMLEKIGNFMQFDSANNLCLTFRVRRRSHCVAREIFDVHRYMISNNGSFQRVRI